MAQQITYCGFSISVTDNCITVHDSYKTSNRELIRCILQYVKKTTPNEVTRKRTIKNLCNEWIAHTRLYHLGIAQSHTRDVDLEYPQSALHSIAWTILGIL